MSEASPRRALILSDGKPGHENQSLALTRHLGWETEVRRVHWRGRGARWLSHLADRLPRRSLGLFQLDGPLPPCTAVIACGAATWYPAKAIARSVGVPCIAMMLPRGYRYDFDLIFAQQHDDPPAGVNICTLPVNANWSAPAGLFCPEDENLWAALVIGGPTRYHRFDVRELEQQLQQIRRLLPGYRLVVASSRRTPPEIEALLERFAFDRSYLYSRDPANPLPDFWRRCDYVFITADSTSMISEAVCAGTAAVEILPVASRPGKHERLVRQLAEQGCLHRFDGSLGAARRKIDLSNSLREAVASCA